MPPYGAGDLLVAANDLSMFSFELIANILIPTF